MSDQPPRVVVISGASQGIGASLVPAYRNLGYAVLGTSRTITPSDDPMFATVQGVKVLSALASLTKGGAAAVTKSLATEYAATGICVNAVSPGVIKTPTHAPETDLGTLHPIGRSVETSDVVSAIMYLESAPFVTGEFMHVDGGQSAGH
jgi:NAD(P)-dependent dehydrogenase (short-subunit alcohol dehydrogenase family)